MRNTWLLSGVLWRESIRSKVLWLFGLAGLLMVAASLLLGEMVVGRPGKAVWDLGLSAINLLSLLIVIFFGTMMSSSDIEGRMMQLLLVKPLRRHQYQRAVFGVLLLLVAAATLFVAFLTWSLLGFSLSSLGLLLEAMAWNLLEMAVMAVLVLFCASLCPPQLAMFLSFCFYVIGHSLEQALRLVVMQGSFFSKALFSLLYGLLPNFSFFNHKSRIAAGLGLPSPWIWLWSVLYAACCVLIWGRLARLLFERREL